MDVLTTSEEADVTCVNDNNAYVDHILGLHDIPHPLPASVIKNLL